MVKQQYYRIHFQNQKKWNHVMDCMIFKLEGHQFKTYVAESREKAYLVIRMKKGIEVNENSVKALENWEFYNSYADKWQNLIVTELGIIYFFDRTF